MLKRILTVSTGMLIGSLIAMGLLHVVMLLGWGPNRDLDQSADYYRQVMALVKSEYVDETKVQPEEMTRAALEGLLRGLDPHSDFLRARDYSALQEDLDSKFGGIGVQIENRDGDVVVIAPIAGTPGERAGILRGDIVREVDGETMRGKSLDDVVDKMRGKPGTDVNVAFERREREDLFRVTITREVIRVESVSDVRMLTEEIGYVRIVQFAEPTAEELGKALAELSGHGARALVLDVRNNPGGLLTSAADVLEHFFARGELMVYTQGRGDADREEFRSGALGDPVELPMAVLVNAGSASAAEILAGALQDTEKAVIVGERSFGKGSVQSLYRLQNGEALRLTTALYFTPGGSVIHEQGVTPDVEVVMTPEEDANVALQRARSDITDPEEFEERFDLVPVADRQLEAALDILRAALGIEDRRMAEAAP